MSAGEALSGADLFSASAQRIVDYLNAHTLITDWSVSRAIGGQQVHVHVHAGDLLHQGKRVDWPETFCSRMMLGAGRIVADSQADPDYADLADAQKIRSYAGFPITDDDGSTFGILCGIGRTPLVDKDAVDADLIELMGDLLSSHLAMARAADRDRRSMELAQALANTDALTGLTNRRGWDMLAADAQERIDAFGDLVSVAVLDLDGLKMINDTQGHHGGDRLIARAGLALVSAAGAGDRVARYGGDEFAILSNNVSIADQAEHYATFVSALDDVGISASLGFAVTVPQVVSVIDAFSSADTDMYAMKESRRGLNDPR